MGTTPDERILGGAFGYGLSRNVRSCYRFLAQKYQPGDELFLFGFSRGAYTARSLAGLIRNCGILRKEHVDQVDEAFAFYRDRTSQSHPSALASQIFRRCTPTRRTRSTSSACGTPSVRLGSRRSCRGGSGSHTTCTGGRSSGGSTTPG